jgi:hypothetical protein
MKRSNVGRLVSRLASGATAVVAMTATIAVTPIQALPLARAVSARVTVPRWQGLATVSTPVPGPYYRPPATPPGVHLSTRDESAWTVRPTPNVRAANGTLVSESCLSARRCQAVGSYADLAGVAVTLAETWDGRTWRTEATPREQGAVASALSGVSCAAQDACIAVGGYIDSTQRQLPLAETWDGVAWKIQPIPNPIGSTSTFLSAVACTSPRHCVAVGSALRPNRPEMLAEEWNGTRWQVLATPKPDNGSGILSALSCAGPNACVAVGSFNGRTLAEFWNGTSWSTQLTPGPDQSFLLGVSCPAIDNCHAVGGYFDSFGTLVSLAEHWNGGSFTREAAPSPTGAAGSSLMAVSCFSTTACTAVGASDGAPLAERFDGTEWHLDSVRNPTGGTFAVLDAVSCRGVEACSTVGSYTNDALFSVTFGEAWNGTAWTMQATTSPTGSANSALQAESCPDATHCEAVGVYVTAMNRGGGLAESRTGTSWAVQRTPNPAGAIHTALTGVACRSASSCVAVGNSTGPTGSRTLAEIWNGKSWRIEPTPTPSNSLGSALEAVSCSAVDACTAVGAYSTLRGQATLVETWNGKSWSIQSSPNPPGSSMDTLTGVSCPTQTACSAVGDEVDAVGTQVPLAESWNGTSWMIRPTRVPAGAVAAVLYGVSCTAAAACTAVGGHVNQSHIGVTLIEMWNGTAWTIRASPSPAGAPLATLTAVWCGSDTCNAVGSTGTVTLAELWNGRSWKLQSTPNLAGTTDSALLAVVCTAPGVCTAVGAAMNATGVESTLAEAEG